MSDVKKEFIEFCLANKVLLFGDFILKSGRKSPYFFNAGLFNNGAALAKLGDYYAQTLQTANIDFDVLFGPAYKGIPLVSATAIAMYHRYHQTIPFAFDRKEAKAHGEGGLLVGSSIENQRVIIVDDVISAGTAVKRTQEILQQYNATLAGIVIAMDRQEVGQSSLSAIQEIEQNYHTKVCSVISLNDLINYLRNDNKHEEQLVAMLKYQAQYGAKN